MCGILIALAADAAWDERVERSGEQAALRQLMAEFEETGTEPMINTPGFRTAWDRERGKFAAASAT